MVSEMTFKQKFAAWTLIVLRYVFAYVPAMLSTYFFLAEDKVEEAGKGGAFFWTLMMIIIIAASISLTKMVNKTKANLFKSFFKGMLKVGFLIVIAFLVKYINFNLSGVLNVIYVSIGGVAIGYALEMIAVGKYRDYIREVGIL